MHLSSKEVLMKEKEILDITNRIYVIRGQKVMLDKDLAEVYEVELKALNQAVKRNEERFPEEFCFKPDFSELAEAKSQNVTCLSLTPRNYKSPTVFTEQGAYALSFILRSQKAVETGIFIAKAFTHLRRFILKNENLMMELKNNDHLSKTFSKFEKRFMALENKMKEVEKKLKK